MRDSMLKIKNLNTTIDDKVILKNFNLIINDGETHVIMGPNGVGKSTLSRVIMGDERYKVIDGDILLDGKSILSLRVDERSKTFIIRNTNLFWYSKTYTLCKLFR